MRKTLQNFYEEAVVWKRLAHPNVVPLLGAAVVPCPPQLISDWVLGRNLTEYVKNYPEADRIGLVGTLPQSDGRGAYHLQAVWCRQRPRVPPLQPRGSREFKGGA